MANLLSQNIGTNYKSILNLDATTINTPLDATLRTVTDGMGTSSPLQLSTDQVGISRTVALSAGATNPRLFNEVYTINNSGAQTGTLTGLFLNATETALNGITHNLMDLQVGGVSKFKVGNGGAITAVGTIGLFTFNSYFYFSSTGGSLTSAGCYEGSTAFSINGGSTYLLRLSASSVEKLTINNVGTIAWGTTSSFPAIKRNGAAIDFRLADDSGYCDVTAQGLIANSGSSGLKVGGAQVLQFATNAIAYGYSGSVQRHEFFTNGGTLAMQITNIGGIVAPLLATTRPAITGTFYVDTAANILANGDKVIGWRV